MENTGQCFCGKVSFTVAGDPLRMAACHCSACRRITGTGHLTQAFYKKDQVNIKGETKTFQSMSDSGNLRTRHFCRDCGSRLFSENAKLPDTIGVAAGAFDNSDWFRPQVALYTSQRPTWDYMDPELKRGPNDMSEESDALADRIRAIIGDDPNVSERKMFGGIALCSTAICWWGHIRTAH